MAAFPLLLLLLPYISTAQYTFRPLTEEELADGWQLPVYEEGPDETPRETVIVLDGGAGATLVSKETFEGSGTFPPIVHYFESFGGVRVENSSELADMEVIDYSESNDSFFESDNDDPISSIEDTTAPANATQTDSIPPTVLPVDGSSTQNSTVVPPNEARENEQTEQNGPELMISQVTTFRPDMGDSVHHSEYTNSTEVHETVQEETLGTESADPSTTPSIPFFGDEISIPHSDVATSTEPSVNDEGPTRDSDDTQTTPAQPMGGSEESTLASSLHNATEIQTIETEETSASHSENLQTTSSHLELINEESTTPSTAVNSIELGVDEQAQQVQSTDSAGPHTTESLPIVANEQSTSTSLVVNSTEAEGKQGKGEEKNTTSTEEHQTTPSLPNFGDEISIPLSHDVNSTELDKNEINQEVEDEDFIIVGHSTDGTNKTMQEAKDEELLLANSSTQLGANGTPVDEQRSIVNNATEVVKQIRGEIHIIALKFTSTGSMRGRAHSDLLCYRQGRIHGHHTPFTALLADTPQDLARLVHEDDQNSVVVNLHGERLFNSWTEFVRGSPMANAHIYSFDTANINLNVAWPVKSAWLGMGGPKCRNWYSKASHELGKAARYGEGGLNITQLHDVRCNEPLALLCVETISRPTLERMWARHRSA